MAFRRVEYDSDLDETFNILLINFLYDACSHTSTHPHIAPQVCTSNNAVWLLSLSGQLRWLNNANRCLQVQQDSSIIAMVNGANCTTRCVARERCGVWRCEGCGQVSQGKVDAIGPIRWALFRPSRSSSFALNRVPSVHRRWELNSPPQQPCSADWPTGIPVGNFDIQQEAASFFSIEIVRLSVTLSDIPVHLRGNSRRQQLAPGLLGPAASDIERHRRPCVAGLCKGRTQQGLRPL